MDEQYLISKNGKEKGVVVSESEEPCEVESCRGTVYLVEWSDRTVTECCSHGLTELKNGDYQII